MIFAEISIDIYIDIFTKDVNISFDVAINISKFAIPINYSKIGAY